MASPSQSGMLWVEISRCECKMREGYRKQYNFGANGSVKRGFFLWAVYQKFSRQLGLRFIRMLGND